MITHQIQREGCDLWPSSSPSQGSPKGAQWSEDLKLVKIKKDHFDSYLRRNVDEPLVDEEAHIPVQELRHILENLPERVHYYVEKMLCS